MNIHTRMYSLSIVLSLRSTSFLATNLTVTPSEQNEIRFTSTILLNCLNFDEVIV